MKLIIISSEKGRFTAEDKKYEFGEPIPITQAGYIRIIAPDGVFRCNLNEGVFEEDRKFIQNVELKTSHIFKFQNIDKYNDPTLTLKVHYKIENGDVVIQFLGDALP